MAHKECLEQYADQREDLSTPEHGKILVKSGLVRNKLIKYLQGWDKAQSQGKEYENDQVCNNWKHHDS